MPRAGPAADPNVLYGVPKGAVQPLGGALGYRGTALALFVEVLTTMLNGDEVDDRSRKGTDMTLLAIAPQPGFELLTRGLSDHMRASPPLDPARPVLMPGDRERVAAGAADTARRRWTRPGQPWRAPPVGRAGHAGARCNARWRWTPPLSQCL